MDVCPLPFGPVASLVHRPPELVLAEFANLVEGSQLTLTFSRPCDTSYSIDDDALLLVNGNDDDIPESDSAEWLDAYRLRVTFGDQLDLDEPFTVSTTEYYDPIPGEAGGSVPAFSGYLVDV